MPNASYLFLNEIRLYLCLFREKSLTDLRQEVWIVIMVLFPSMFQIFSCIFDRSVLITGQEPFGLYKKWWSINHVSFFRFLEADCSQRLLMMLSANSLQWWINAVVLGLHLLFSLALEGQLIVCCLWQTSDKYLSYYPQFKSNEISI